jgi:hypothetical protein
MFPNLTASNVLTPDKSLFNVQKAAYKTPEKQCNIFTMKRKWYEEFAFHIANSKEDQDHKLIKISRGQIALFYPVKQDPDAGVVILGEEKPLPSHGASSSSPFFPYRASSKGFLRSS